MKIKFNENIYNLAYDPYINGTRLLVTMQKSEHTYDNVVVDTENAERIVILNDNDETVGVYTGFTTRIAIVITDFIQVEFENTDIVNQLSTIIEQVSTQEAAIADLALAAEQANDTNDTQDAAIADLADIVNSITPEEG